jgi:hypothetical protein
MKTKAWGAVVMVAFAWVLWARMPVTETEEAWRVMDGYKSIEGCRKNQKIISGNISKNMKSKGLSWNIVYKKKHSFQIACLHHSVDPTDRKIPWKINLK